MEQSMPDAQCPFLFDCQGFAIDLSQKVYTILVNRSTSVKFL